MNAREYVFRVPPGWIELDSKTGETHRSFAELTDNVNLDSVVATRLNVALENVWQAAQSRPRDGGHTWALIRDPLSGNVDAMLTLDVRALTEGYGFDRYLALVTESVASDEALEVVNRTFSTLALPSGPTIVVHDFVLPVRTGDVQDPAVERLVCAVFPGDWDVVAEFAVVTQNLSLFDDIAAEVLPIVGTFTVLPDAGMSPS